jgi:hypothetical protein
MPRWVRPIGFKSRERTERFADRQRCTALSMMVSNMGCKSCGEPAMARSTAEMAARAEGLRPAPFANLNGCEQLRALRRFRAVSALAVREVYSARAWWH